MGGKGKGKDVTGLIMEVEGIKLNRTHSPLLANSSSGLLTEQRQHHLAFTYFLAPYPTFFINEKGGRKVIDAHISYTSRPQRKNKFLNE